MAPLDGAVALADGDDLAMRIGEELDLHVSGPLEVALAVEGAVAERAFRLPRGGRERVFDLSRRPDDTHPAPATARDRFDEEREADLLRRAVRENGDADFAGDPLRGQLVAAESQRLRPAGRPRSDPRPRLPPRSRRSRRGSRSRDGWRPQPLAFAARMCSSECRYDAISTRLVGRAGVERPASSGATTATVSMPSSRHVRKMRTAISPRFATSNRLIGTRRL